MFKNVIAVTLLTIALATPSFATDRSWKPSFSPEIVQNNNTKVHQKQSQGQAQVQGQQQSASGGNSANSYKSTSVSAPGIAAGDMCVSAGGVYGAGGFCWKSRHTKVMQEAAEIGYAGGDPLRHLCMFNQRVRKSQCSGVTDQTYNGTFK